MPEHTITVYGAPGTFRHLTLDTPVTSTGHDIGTVGVAGWGFEPGASAFFASVTDGGRVLFATVPQTDNQAAPTGQTMSVGVLDPTGGAGPTFRSLRVPTTKGLSYVMSPDRFTGGGPHFRLKAGATPKATQAYPNGAGPFSGTSLKSSARPCGAKFAFVCARGDPEHTDLVAREVHEPLLKSIEKIIGQKAQFGSA